MTKPTFYAAIITLALLVPFSILGVMGSMVSKKYEVDMAYNYPYGNEELTEAERHENVIILQREFELDMQIMGYVILGSAAILTIVILSWRRYRKLNAID